MPAEISFNSLATDCLIHGWCLRMSNKEQSFPGNWALPQQWTLGFCKMRLFLQHWSQSGLWQGTYPTGLFLLRTSPKVPEAHLLKCKWAAIQVICSLTALWQSCFCSCAVSPAPLQLRPQRLMHHFICFFRNLVSFSHPISGLTYYLQSPLFQWADNCVKSPPSCTRFIFGPQRYTWSFRVPLDEPQPQSYITLSPNPMLLFRIHGIAVSTSVLNAEDPRFNSQGNHKIAFVSIQRKYGEPYS